MEQKNVTSHDLSLHKSPKNAWVAINGKGIVSQSCTPALLTPAVYNVSSYLNEHPGGEEILLDVAGDDATTAFEDVGHSTEAREAMETLFVGNLVGYVAPTAKFVFATKKLQKTSKPEILDIVKPNKSMIRTVALVGATATGGAAAWSRIWSSLPALSVDWIMQDSNQSIQLFINALAFASTMAMCVSAYKFKKTLDLDYEVEHYKPYLKSKGLFDGPPRCRSRPTALLNSTFNPFRLIRRQRLSHNTYRFTFALSHSLDSLELPIGRHIVLQAEIDGKLVSRSYTPTSSNSDLGNMDLTIKVYPKGAMGNYLLSLPLQQHVKMRGPAGKFTYNRFTCDKIICIAGGSGITPMLQIIRTVCNDPADKTVVSLLYANQTEEDILLSEELEGLLTRNPCQLSAKFFLDRPPQGWNGGVGFVEQEDIRKCLPKSGSKSVKVLICGPPPMVESMRAIMVSLGLDDPGLISKPDGQVYIF